MGNTVIKGPSAELRLGYHQAAVLGDFSIIDGPAGCDLTAAVVSHVAFRTSQTGLTFRVVRPHAMPWVWPVESLDISGDTLTARLTPQKD